MLAKEVMFIANAIEYVFNYFSMRVLLIYVYIATLYAKLNNTRYAFFDFIFHEINWLILV